MTERLYLDHPYQHESTAEIGRARIVRIDNKGRENRRFYWEV
jgi:hypothetical protein